MHLYETVHALQDIRKVKQQLQQIQLLQLNKLQNQIAHQLQLLQLISSVHPYQLPQLLQLVHLLKLPQLLRQVPLPQPPEPDQYLLSLQLNTYQLTFYSDPNLAQLLGLALGLSLMNFAQTEIFLHTYWSRGKCVKTTLEELQIK